MTTDPPAPPAPPARRKPPASSNRHQHSKRAHAAFLLPVAGLLLIVPPLLTLFGGRHWLFGAPLQTVYLFAVWLALIVGAALLSRRLPAAGTDEDGEAAEDSP